MTSEVAVPAPGWERDGLGAVAIVGAGQVGTMLGMALRAGCHGPAADVALFDRDPAADVALFDRDPAAAAASLARGAGDRLLAGPAEALAADTLVLALPVPDVLEFLREYGAAVRPGSLVLDTASAKGMVVRTMRECLPAGVHAMGGHPMAGTEGTGPAAARPELLHDAVFVLTPVRTDPAASARGLAFVRALGARPVEMDAAVHDATVARTSHLPHVAAFAVAAAAGRAAAGPGFAPGLAATGYRSATRLAASDPRMVASFLWANGAEVRAGIGELRDWLIHFEAALESGPEPLAGLLADARSAGAVVT